ncbi:MAG: carbon-nitrogen hydrolase family protein [Eubacteriales bacterium]|nr:carbon-nitrogen hydrolase family protein [Eubacteriales bacterium]MDD4390796.1 carbon-nitrogen hydrolase family protein [Eubacteriales bacterium]
MFKLALCQTLGSPASDVEQNKKETFYTAEKYIRQAAAEGADFAVLPEMWNCPYSNSYFREYAETEKGPTVAKMSDLAKELGIYLIGGTIPERDEESDKLYNTCFAFDRSGNLIGRHRKAHLFDIDIKDRILADGTVKKGITFYESKSFSAGDDITIIDTEFCKVGIAICFDIRFPEFFRKMVLQGAKLIILPAAFNMTTGPAHWDLSIRARALDNQIFFAAAAPARDESAPYRAYGNSCVAEPFGSFIAHADEKECLLMAEIDLERLDLVRDELPLLKSLRPEIY